MTKSKKKSKSIGDLSIQQETFLKAFLDPKSPTWANYRQSALKAGYSKDYSDNISVEMPDWLRNSLGKTRIVQKAENNLEVALEGGLDQDEKGSKNIQWKATEFTLKTLRKDEYSERQEITGKDGKDLIPEVDYDSILDEYVRSNKGSK